MVLTVVLCPRKQLYFDEPFQIMCSHGITLGNVQQFTDKGTFTSADLNKENTFHNVFMLGADSIHYPMLHYLNLAFGNDLNVAVYFSVFWGLLCLLAFYVLCRKVIGDNIYTSVALILFFTDILFLNQAYSIRHYIMSLFVTLMSGIYFFKYMFEEKSFKNLLWMAIWCATGIISHYFTIYIIMVYPVAILAEEKAKFFTWKKIVAVAIPIVFLLVYFQFHWNPFQSTAYYQHYIKTQHIKINNDIGFRPAVAQFMRSVAVNFQVYYPLFRDNMAVRLGSVLIVLLVYFIGLWKLVPGTDERKKFHLLFALGILSSFFITVMAVKTKNNMLFSYRYFLFSMPFCVLFISLFIRQLCAQSNLNIVLKVAVVAVLVAPGFYKFIAAHRGYHDNGLECNQLVAVHEITKKGIHKIEVPHAVDAVFINSLLPLHYDITYTLNPTTDSATLYHDEHIAEKYRFLDNGLVVMF
jgi:4-amino-4-deoxy-L-arabinose transferase-like glycosyltransferase